MPLDLTGRASKVRRGADALRAKYGDDAFDPTPEQEVEAWAEAHREARRKSIGGRLRRLAEWIVKRRQS